MNGKRIFNPGDVVSTFAGHVGLVISEKELELVRLTYKEGNRPGRYFAPGCCQQPDYVIQIPVLFEDKTFDVMRAMNIKRSHDLSAKRKARLEGLIAG